MRKLIAIIGMTAAISCGSNQGLVSVNENNVEKEVGASTTGSTPTSVTKPSQTISNTPTESPSETSTTQKEAVPASGTLGGGRTVTVKKTMEFLASDERGGRATGSEGIDRAATYIEGRFKRSKIPAYFGTNYRNAFEAKGKTGFNIVGVLEGTDPVLKNEVIIIGAHYDHIGNGKPVNGDVIANGANDNASGTTTVLAVADHFAKAKNNKRTLVFALFSAEEMGLLGSAALAVRLKKDGMNLYSMFNIEMVGVPMEGKDHLVYCSGYDKSNMASKFNTYAGEKVIGFLPKAKEFQLFRRSDNYPFYEAFRIPAHTISSFDFTNYEYYHHVDDEPSQMDYVHMQKVIDKIIPGITGMANSALKEIKMN